MAALALNGLFWGVFLARAVVGRARSDRSGRPTSDGTTRAAPLAAPLVAAHAVAFLLLYAGLAAAPGRRGHGAGRAAGAGLILAATGLAGWTVAVFRSWRLRAVVEPGHVLSTDGPFALVRHPIYAALNLVALGTALWAPSATTALAVALIALVGDVRARGEEALLGDVFGAEYRSYMARVPRFVPWLY